MMRPTRPSSSLSGMASQAAVAGMPSFCLRVNFKIPNFSLCSRSVGRAPTVLLLSSDSLAALLLEVQTGGAKCSLYRSNRAVEIGR